MPQRHYVQIGGNMKSGTSLLAALFDDHPDILTFPGQTSLTGRDYPFFSDPNVALAEKLQGLRAKIEQNKRIASIPRSLERLDELSAGMGNDFLSLHHGLLQASCEPADPEKWRRARFWLDKSPFSHVYADELFELFPSMKFIHIIREPKDNFASAGARLFLQHAARVDKEALLWRYLIWTSNSLAYAARNVDRHGEVRYRVVRYEDLVMDPEATMQGLADFIGIEMRPELCNPTRAGRQYRGNNKEGVRFDGVDPGNVGRWRERVPDYYSKVMETQPLEPLQRFGYEPVFTPRARMLAGAAHRTAVRFIPRRVLTRHSRTAGDKIVYDRCLFAKPELESRG